MLAQSDKKDEFAVIVGRNILYYRNRRKLTQRAVAIGADITDICLSRYENGNQAPSLKTAKRLAYVLHCTVDDILDEQMPLPSRGDLLVGVA